MTNDIKPQGQVRQSKPVQSEAQTNRVGLESRSTDSSTPSSRMWRPSISRSRPMLERTCPVYRITIRQAGNIKSVLQVYLSLLLTQLRRRPSHMLSRQQERHSPAKSTGEKKRYQLDACAILTSLRGRARKTLPYIPSVSATA